MRKRGSGTTAAQETTPVQVKTDDLGVQSITCPDCDLVQAVGMIQRNEGKCKMCEADLTPHLPKGGTSRVDTVVEGKVVATREVPGYAPPKEALTSAEARTVDMFPEQAVTCPCGHVQTWKLTKAQDGCMKCGRKTISITLGTTNGLVCSVCGDLQYKGVAGVKCSKGHTGAGMKLEDWEAKEVDTPAQPASFPKCPECGARLTETNGTQRDPKAAPHHGDGKHFCPDASTVHVRMRAEAEVKKNQDSTPETRSGASSRAGGWERDKAGAPAPAISSDEVTVTIGAIKFSPRQYHTFEVGSFSGRTTPREGETVADAGRRLRLELARLQEEEFARQLAAYQTFMNRMYGEGVQTVG